MKSWLTVFILNMFLPALMIFIGWLMRKHPPKKINFIYGYRTAMSRKNQDTWDFAHATCGKIWWRFGWALLATTALVQIPFFGGNDDTLGKLTVTIYTVQCILLLISILPVERALKKNFNPDGSRK